MKFEEWTMEWVLGEKKFYETELDFNKDERDKYHDEVAVLRRIVRNPFKMFLAGKEGRRIYRELLVCNRNLAIETNNVIGYEQNIIKGLDAWLAADSAENLLVHNCMKTWYNDNRTRMKK